MARGSVTVFVECQRCGHKGQREVDFASGGHVLRRDRGRRDQDSKKATINAEPAEHAELFLSDRFSGDFDF